MAKRKRITKNLLKSKAASKKRNARKRVSNAIESWNNAGKTASALKKKREKNETKKQNETHALSSTTSVWTVKK